MSEVTKQIETEVDHLLWFPEAINELTRKGVKDPIFRVLELFRTDNIKWNAIQRHLEKAIGKLIQNDAKTWKPKIETIQPSDNKTVYVVNVYGRMEHYNGCDGIGRQDHLKSYLFSSKTDGPVES